jgi:hypothetical protein
MASLVQYLQLNPKLHKVKAAQSSAFTVSFLARNGYELNYFTQKDVSFPNT